MVEEVEGKISKGNFMIFRKYNVQFYLEKFEFSEDEEKCNQIIQRR